MTAADALWTIIALAGFCLVLAVLLYLERKGG